MSDDNEDDNFPDFDEAPTIEGVKGRFKPGESGNKRGRPKGTFTAGNISQEDRDYYGVDSKKFLERALLKARTWEEGLRYARELRALQHASLQSIQTKVDNTNTLVLRWSRPDEVASNEYITIEGEYADVKQDTGKDNKE